MCDHTNSLPGPDFLDKVADAEAANGNDINAAIYRERSQQWQRDQDRITDLEKTVAALERRLARINAAAALPA